MRSIARVALLLTFVFIGCAKTPDTSTPGTKQPADQNSISSNSPAILAAIEAAPASNPESTTVIPPATTTDTTPPTLLSLTPTSSVVNPTPTSVVATFSKAMAPLSASQFTLGGTCTRLPTRGIVRMSDDRTMAILGLSAETCTNGETLTVSLDPTQVSDSHGNKGTGNSITNTYTVNTLGPSASLSTPFPTRIHAPTSSTLNLTYTPSAIGDITLTGTLTEAGEGVTIIPLSGNPSCSVSVSAITTSGAQLSLHSCSGNGTLIVQVNEGTAKDNLNNSSLASSVSAPITVDNTPPTLLGFTPSSSYVYAQPTTVIARFDKPMIPLSASQFTLTGSCTSQTSEVSMNSDNTTATLTLSGPPCTNGQILTVSLDPTKAIDSLGRAGTGTLATRTYTVNTLGPLATLADPSSTLINATGTSTLALTYTSSAAGGTALTGTLRAAGGGVTVTPVSTVANQPSPTCQVSVGSISQTGALITLHSCTGSGVLTVHVDAGTVQDSLSNPNTVSSESAPITVDTSTPTILSFSPASSFVNPIPSNVMVTFSQPIASLTANNFTIDGSCTSLPRISTVNMSNNNTIAKLTLSGGTCTNEQGLALSIDPTTLRSTRTGNQGTGEMISNLYSISTAGPRASLAAPSSTSINATGTSTLAVTYHPSRSPVLLPTLTAGGVTITPVSTVGGQPPSCTVFVSDHTGGIEMTPARATISLRDCHGSGTITVHVNAGTAQDSLGNNSTQSSESALITVDTAPPTVNLLTMESPTASSTPATITVTFSKALGSSPSFSPNLFTVTGSCTAPTIGSVNMNPQTTIATFPLTGGSCAGGQTVVVTLDPTQITDSAGNQGAGSAVTTTYKFLPTVSLLPPSLPIMYFYNTTTITVNYTGNLSHSLTPADFIITPVTGNPACTVAVNANIISLNGCTGNGMINVQAKEGVAIDSSGGYGSPASNSVSISVSPPGRPTSSLISVTNCSFNFRGYYPEENSCYSACPAYRGYLYQTIALSDGTNGRCYCLTSTSNPPGLPCESSGLRHNYSPNGVIANY